MIAQFYRNQSDISQLFFDRFQNPITLIPGEIRDVSSGVTSTHLVSVPSVIDYVLDLKQPSITLSRYSAIGDVLMMVPVARYLHEVYGLDVYIKSYENVFKTIQLLDVPCFPDYSRNYSGLLISLNDIVEQDHRNKEAQKYHRVAIYLRSLGINKVDKKKINWDCNLEKFGSPVIEGRYLAIQFSGSHKAKSLPKETSDFIINQLVEKYKKVVVLGEKSIIREEGKATIESCFSISEIFNVVGYAQYLICMDSMPLWVSHFTKTAVLAILGPTPEKNRLSMHPLWPEGATALQLNKYINCESCFENATSCGWKMDCLKIDKEVLLSRITDYVEKFMGGDNGCS
jgi:ADP-heptose:LPS heptosyltransferase